MSEKKYKILIFTHDSSLYGASKSLLTLIDYWKKKQSEIEILVLLPYKGIIEHNLKSSGINYKVVDIPRVDYKFKNQSFLSILKMWLRFSCNENKAIKIISKITEEFQPDIIYTNTSVIGTGYKISRIFKKPFVWHVREFGWEDYKLKYLPSLKIHRNKIKNSPTIFVSKALQNYWLAGDVKKHSQVIYNGFIENEASETPNRKIPENEIIIGILGAIMPGKGQLEAIKAIDILNQKGIKATLEIYGSAFDKNYETELKLFLEKNNHLKNCIKFCGFNNNPKEIYDRISIMLNCSVSEGFGRTIVEAMLEKIPVVANNAGAIPEIIEHYYNGLIYNQTPESLAEKLEILINNKILWSNLTENAFNFAQKNYSVQKYADSVLLFLKKSLINNE